MTSRRAIYPDVFERFRTYWGVDSLGLALGDSDGEALGFPEGEELGRTLGRPVGLVDGMALGNTEGALEGTPDGRLGRTDGITNNSSAPAPGSVGLLNEMEPPVSVAVSGGKLFDEPTR